MRRSSFISTAGKALAVSVVLGTIGATSAFAADQSQLRQVKIESDVRVNGVVSTVVNGNDNRVDHNIGVTLRGVSAESSTFQSSTRLNGGSSVLVNGNKNAVTHNLGLLVTNK